MAETQALRELMKDISIEGAVVVNKRKLLWLLGWGQDRPGAWTDLRNAWVDVGGDAKSLYGVEVSGQIVLTNGVGNNTLEPVEDWAE